MTAIPRNPIYWREELAQIRRAPRAARRDLLGALLGSTLCVGLAVWVYTVTEGYPAMQIALYAVWALNVALALRAISAGANAISREHVGLTWDALVLSGVSVRQILIGKWRAVLRRSVGWMLLFGVTRVALIPVFSLGIVKTYASYYAQSSRYVSARMIDYPNFYWIPWAWLLAVLASVALTFLEVGCCTALGLAASAFTRRTTSAMILAIIIRFLPVMFFSAFMRYELGVTYFWRWWGRTEFGLADAGNSALMVLGLPDMPWTHGDHFDTLPGLLLATLLLAGLTIGSLVAAWWIIRRSGALPARKGRLAA